MTVVTKTDNEIVVHEDVVALNNHDNGFLILFRDDYLYMPLNEIISVY